MDKDEAPEFLINDLKRAEEYANMNVWIEMSLLEEELNISK